MLQETVVVIGQLAVRMPLERLLAEFGWSLEVAATLDCLARISSRANVAAILVDPVTLDLPWKSAVVSARREAPGALLILCQPFSGAVEWTEASAAGVFHSLGLPLHLDELRQSLGFVWAERNKRAKKVVALETGDRARRILNGRARGHVA